MNKLHKQAIIINLLILLNCHANDMISLLSFKSSISHDPHQALASWNESSLNYCNWKGVRCSLKHSSKVIELNLDSLDITGTISPSIANISFLQRLNLPNNHLHGQIPPELGSLRRLRYLNLSKNSLTGEIPIALSQCSQLQVISLSSNKLQGDLPSNLSNCLKLKIIILKNNFFTGSIPSVFTTLPKLIYLNVAANNITGIIPSSLGNLTNFFALDVSQNMINGNIPSSITRLSSLMFLYLNKNSLNGNLPSSIGNISSLKYLDFSKNNLTGELPHSIGNISSLTYFDVTLNSFSGIIPSSFGGLSMLTSLALTSNYFSGNIPPSLGSLSSIIDLVMSHNQLSGTIPHSIFNSSSVESIGLSDNHLYGNLPQDLGNHLPHLRALTIYFNRLNGTIPTSLTNATTLEDVEASGNNFTGKIPTNLGNLRNLYWLALDHNQLEAFDDDGWSFLTSLQNCSQLQVLQLQENMLRGAFPQSVANLSTSLRWLNLEGNQISGTLHGGIENLVGLVFLNFNENHLEGNIPDTISKLQNLETLAVSNNKFSGSILDSLGNLTKLTELNMKGNSFEGSIPKRLGECQNLETLDFSRNRLTGTIPKEILIIKSLSISFDLSYNQLNGFLPAEVGMLNNLREFRVSSNNLSGEIPRTIGECVLMEILYLEGNQFDGKIPQSMSNLRGLQELDISQNRLSGHITEFLEDFSFLQYLNLSFNDFEGQVPRNGIFRNASVVSLNGNDRLCGGDPILHLLPCIIENQITRHHSRKLKVILSISISTLCLILLVFLISYWYCSHNRIKKTQTLDSMKELHPKVSFSELFNATDGFSSQNLIGEGTFSAVYKGNIALGQQKVVAIKVLKLEQNDALKGFAAECNVLRSIRHRNLIKILSSCSSIDYEGKDFKALVFEYMTNGSLQTWLHPKESHENQKQKLSFIQRLNIAIDIASALDYLHQHAQTPIIHCDLKPSNVLLDDDLTAHVGDFGLAKFLTKITTISSHNSSMSIGIKGTIGYLAPEYGTTNQVSTYGDIYSYGIILLEMFTAMSPTDDSLKDGISLHMFVQNALPEHVTDITDPFLLFEENVGEDVYERLQRQEILCSTFKIGLFCSKESPRERMGIEYAIKELNLIRRNVHAAEARRMKTRREMQTREGTSCNT